METTETKSGENSPDKIQSRFKEVVEITCKSRVKKIAKILRPRSASELFFFNDITVSSSE